MVIKFTNLTQTIRHKRKIFYAVSVFAKLRSFTHIAIGAKIKCLIIMIRHYKAKDEFAGLVIKAIDTKFSYKRNFIHIFQG